MIITLIGMAGVGKSTIGKLLASHLGYSFVDVDDLIKQRIGGQLQDYLEEKGDSAFIKDADIIVDINGMTNKKKVVDDIVERSKELYNSTF